MISNLTPKDTAVVFNSRFKHPADRCGRVFITTSVPRYAGQGTWIVPLAGIDDPVSTLALEYAKAR